MALRVVGAILSLMSLCSCVTTAQVQQADLSLVSDRIVADQDSRIYDGVVEGQHCYKANAVRLDDAEDAIGIAVRDAISKQPGANALIKVSITYLPETTFKGCMKVKGTPVEMK